jgi:hypothetical protein
MESRRGRMFEIRHPFVQTWRTEPMGKKAAKKHHEEAVRMLATIHEFANDPEVVGDRYEAIHNLVLGPLRAALDCDPDYIPALEMRVRVMTDELGAYAEALDEATELVKKDPNNAEYHALRARILQSARACYPDMQFE